MFNNFANFPNKFIPPEAYLPMMTGPQNHFQPQFQMFPNNPNIPYQQMNENQPIWSYNNNLERNNVLLTNPNNVYLRNVVQQENEVLKKYIF